MSLLLAAAAATEERRRPLICSVGVVSSAPQQRLGPFQNLSLVNNSSNESQFHTATKIAHKTSSQLSTIDPKSIFDSEIELLAFNWQAGISTPNNGLTLEFIRLLAGDKQKLY